MTDLRQQLIDSARRMQAAGLNRGTAGNLSVRVGEAGTGNDGDFLITPTGMAYDELVAADIVHMRHEGTLPGSPQAVVRVALPPRPLRCPRRRRRHPARAFAVRHQPRLPAPRHPAIPLHDRTLWRRQCSLRRYATFGTQALSDAVLLAIANRRACLLANHGMLVLGDDLATGARPRHRTRGTLRTVLARLPARSTGAARCHRDGDGPRKVRRYGQQA
jgi:L-fuculose-phosphate aldolase